MSSRHFGWVVEKRPDNKLVVEHKLPGWWQRRQMHIEEGDIVRCAICGEKYRWTCRNGGLTDLVWDWEPVPPEPASRIPRAGSKGTARNP